MGSLHHLPMAAGTHARLLEQLVNEAIASHPDVEVARIWASLAGESLRRYASPPMPSHPVLDLSRIDGLTAEQKTLVQSVVQEWLEHYLNDVRQQLMSIHRDFLSLQKQVAELETERQRR
ncbi:hypothetical protein ACUNV4_08915 [Granulosicoccus sp. 3-233]|uniref:hypothetical protein n=1 Tax=Granulosicoccus sp. 3-233 TaxID=3417969 RepID=UPI003D342E36